MCFPSKLEIRFQRILFTSASVKTLYLLTPSDSNCAFSDTKRNLSKENKRAKRTLLFISGQIEHYISGGIKVKYHQLYIQFNHQFMPWKSERNPLFVPKEPMQIQE